MHIQTADCSSAAGFSLRSVCRRLPPEADSRCARTAMGYLLNNLHFNRHPPPLILDPYFALRTKALQSTGRILS